MHCCTYDLVALYRYDLVALYRYDLVVLTRDVPMDILIF